MLSPRWRKVLRDLWNNKSRTALVVLSIAVGVFAIGLISGTQVILSRDLPVAYAAVKPANASIFTATTFDDDLVETLRNMPELEWAEGRRSVIVRLKVGPDEWKDMQLYAIPDYDDIQIDIVKPVSGAWPPPQHEVLIERASLGMTGAQVGDELVIELPDGKQRTIQVAGLAHDFNQVPAMLVGTPFGYVTFETLEWLDQPRDYNQINLRVAENQLDADHIQQVANAVRDKMEKGGQVVVSVFIPVPGKHPIDNLLQPMLLLLGGVGFLSLCLSGFLVINTISALLTQQTRQIGVMKAIGARSGQLVGMYFGTVLMFGALSLLIAVPLGIGGARLFTQVIAGFLNFDISSYSVPTDVLALQGLVGLLVPLLAATWPVLSGTRLTVHQAMNSYGLGQGRFGTSGLDRLIARIRGLPRPLMLSLRNTFRRRGRLILTLITLTIASAIFVTVFSLRASLLQTLDDALNFWNYDVAIIFNRAYRIEQMEREALRVPGVTAAESWGISTVRRQRPDGKESAALTMYGLRPDTKLLRLTLLEGRWLMDGDENAIVVNTDFLRDESDVAVGDEITLKLRGRDTKWRVVGLVRGLLTGPILFANYPYLARSSGEMGRAGWLLATTEQKDAASQTQVVTALEEHFERIGFQVTQSATIAVARQLIEGLFTVIVSFIAAMAVVLGVVGGLGLMGTMSINVIERTREIGVLRAIGASNGAVLQIFIVEGILIGMISWALGTLLAIPLSRLICDALGNALFRAPLSYTFSIPGALGWLVVVILLAALASFLPAHGASRLSVREVLAYE